jgi:methylenetetrahydrofolate--tRNA-(uracil-5-)-methyltransferase
MERRRHGTLVRRGPYIQHAEVPRRDCPVINTSAGPVRPTTLSYSGDWPNLFRDVLCGCARPQFNGAVNRLRPVHVIGGGLAGCEAAWQLARHGIPVVLHEMRPVRATAVHQTSRLAELVCSNSFRSDEPLGSAIGLLHAEMRQLDSLIMHAADAHKLPAGGALAVDRDGFAKAVTATLAAEPLVTIRREEISAPPAEWDSVIVATGPLTSTVLADAIRGLTGEDALAFFDAIAPIVYRNSIDMEVAWFQSRYD